MEKETKWQRGPLYTRYSRVLSSFTTHNACFFPHVQYYILAQHRLAAAFAAVLSALAALEAGKTGADTAADGTLLAFATTHASGGLHGHGLDGTRLLGADSGRGLGSHLLGDHLGLRRRHFVYCGNKKNGVNRL